MVTAAARRAAYWVTLTVSFPHLHCGESFIGGGAWARVVYSLYPVGMVRTWARVAGFQRMNPMVESSAMRSAVGVFGQVPVFVELGGDETAVTGVAAMVDACQSVHPVVQDVLGAAGGIFGGGLSAFSLYFHTGNGKKSSTFLQVVSAVERSSDGAAGAGAGVSGRGMGVKSSWGLFFNRRRGVSFCGGALLALGFV